MYGKRLKVLKIVVTVTVIVFSLWFVQNVRERRKMAQREANYQTVLATYADKVKPGMTREEVEQHLEIDGRHFRQMCCVANYRREHVSFVGTSWDDLVKVGEESTPWFCSENDVYIAFEFNPKSRGELADTNGSDIPEESVCLSPTRRVPVTPGVTSRLHSKPAFPRSMSDNACYQQSFGQNYSLRSSQGVL
jgi:hypothetical protein